MSRSLFRNWIAALAVLAWSPLPAAHADLSWRAPEFNTDGTPLTDLAGYTIYAGCFESGSYELQPAIIDSPTVTTYRYEGLPNGATCYFTATAVNAAGGESAYSAEATKVTAALDEPIPGPVENLQVTWGESVMALAFTSLDSAEETSTDNTMTSASLSPTSGAVIYVAIAASVASGAFDDITFDGSVSGLSGTWTKVAGPVQYGSRRVLVVFRGTKATAWGTGTLTIQCPNDNVQAEQDMAYVIDEVTGADETTPNDTAVTGAGSDNLTLGDVGTPDSGDAVYVVGTHEDGANNFAATGYTGITTLGALSNIRQIRTFYDDTTPDETPNLTSDGGGNAVGGIAFIVNVGAASGDMTATGSQSFGSSADLDATGALQGTGAIAFSAAADLDATGALSAVGALAFASSADLDAVGALSGLGALAFTGSADLDALGALAAVGATAITSSADLTGSAENDMAAVGAFSVTPSADLEATGSLAVSDSSVFSGTADLSATGALTAVGSIAWTSAADLDALGSLGAAASIAFAASADLDAVGAMLASSTLTFSSLAALTDANAAAQPRVSVVLHRTQDINTGIERSTLTGHGSRIIKSGD